MPYGPWAAIDCQSCTEVPRLDWLEVEMGDMISLSVVGVDKVSYEECPLGSEGLTPLLKLHETKLSEAPKLSERGGEGDQANRTYCMAPSSSVIRLMMPQL